MKVKLEVTASPKCVVPGCSEAFVVSVGFGSRYLCHEHLNQWFESAQYRRAGAQLQDFALEREAEQRNSNRGERG